MLTTLPPSGAVVMQSGNLNFLEPSGPIKACNRIALPLRLVTCVLNGHLKRVMIPDAALIQFVLKMGTIVLGIYSSLMMVLGPKHVGAFLMF